MEGKDLPPAKSIVRTKIVVEGFPGAVAADVL
jgi:hypothetical protein